MSADDVEAVTDSGVAPTPNLGTVAVNFTVGQQLSDLQLSEGLGSGSAPGTRQFAVGSGLGPGTGGVPPPVTDQQGQFSAGPTNSGAITHPGNNLNATQSANSTQQGFESAAATFHGNIEPPKALIDGAQSLGPDNEAEMPEDGDRPYHTAMDDSNTQADTQHPSTGANQQPASLGATSQPLLAVTFDPDVIANLVQTASSGQFWDTPGTLKGATAAQMQAMQAMLQQMAATQKPAEIIVIHHVYLCTVNTFPPQLPVITAGPGPRISGQILTNQIAAFTSLTAAGASRRQGKAVTD